MQLVDINPGFPRGRQSTPAKLASMAHARAMKQWYKA